MESVYWGNRYWTKKDLHAFDKWLRAHGSSFAKWVVQHPPAAKRVFGVGTGQVPKPPPKPPSLADIAGKRWDQENNPGIASLEAEAQRAADAAAQRMRNTQAIYAALAGQLGSIAPQIQGAYQGAENTMLAGGKGFSNEEVKAATAEGDKAAGYLAAAGAPAAAIEGAQAAAGGTGSGDVVYGTGGYIPASTMAREGAGFTAAAAMLPAEGVGYGMNALRDILAQTEADQKTFSDKIAEIRAGRAAGVQKIIDDLLEQQRAERALQLQEGYLGNTQRETSAKITGYDPVTGMPTYETRADAAARKAAAAKVKADAKSAAAKAAKDAKSKNAATRAAGIKAREDAFASARRTMATDAASMAGHELTLKEKVAWAVAHKQPVSKAPNRGGGLSYAEAKRRLFNKYKDLLRYATAAGRGELKRRLNQMIDEVLASFGIRPGRSAPRGTGAGPQRAGGGPDLP